MTGRLSFNPPLHTGKRLRRFGRLRWIVGVFAAAIAMACGGVCTVDAQQPRLTPPGDPPEVRQPGLRINLPANLPGATAPPIALPPYNPDRPQDRIDAINRLFPPLPPLPPPIYPALGPGEQPLRLGDLEALGLSASPVITQAMADITAARGNAIQVGTHPNPTVGLEADTVGSSRNPNYWGGYFSQWIKTAGKLQLAQAAATVDVDNAELALRKARIGLITQVQAQYYAVLVAEEAVRTTEALVRFADQAYRVQVEQLRGGEAAAYEPLQLRVLALQARGALIQARNRYFSAWKQLAATVNAPNLPPTQLAGNPTVAVPPLRFDVLREVVWERHPDILSARNSETQARINLRFEEITPIPDVYLYSTLQKDYTTGSPGASFNMQLGIPVPLFDRNVGGILQAQGQLNKAALQATRVRNELTRQLADDFERYENNRAVLDYYRGHILPDQARAYRGTYERHQQQPDRVGFADVVVAQQTYSAAITSYIAALGAQWTAVTDLLYTVQSEDLLELRSLMRERLEQRPESPPQEVIPLPQPPQP